MRYEHGQTPSPERKEGRERKGEGGREGGERRRERKIKRRNKKENGKFYLLVHV